MSEILLQLISFKQTLKSNIWAIRMNGLLVSTVSVTPGIIPITNRDKIPQKTVKTLSLMKKTRAKSQTLIKNTSITVKIYISPRLLLDNFKTLKCTQFKKKARNHIYKMNIQCNEILKIALKTSPKTKQNIPQITAKNINIRATFKGINNKILDLK